MTTLNQTLLGFLRRPKTPVDAAARLMESAGRRAGRDPHQAQELRRAALAWMRVVR